MIPISFRCKCFRQFISKSGVYKTAEKQLHHAGWISITESCGHVQRVCPTCLNHRTNQRVYLRGGKGFTPILP